MSRPKKKKPQVDRRRRKLARVTVSVSPRPGAPAQAVSLLDALAAADRLRDEKSYGLTAHICDQLIAQKPGLPEPRVILLQVAIEMHRYREGLDMAEALLGMDVAEPYAADVVSRALRLSNRHEQAIELLDRTIRKFPRNVRLREMRAVTCGDVGRLDEAADGLRAIVREKPGHFSAWQDLAALGRVEPADIATIEKLPVPDAERSRAAFALAGGYGRAGDVEREFYYLDRAHAAAAAAVTPHDPALDEKWSRAVIRICNAEFFRRHARAADGGERQPVFIVGMPRSGSTLIEQMLSSIDAVGSAGESALFESALIDLEARKQMKWPEIFSHLDQEDLAWLAGEYLANITRVYTDREVFVDKTLGYYVYVGVLAVTMPRAKFIHALRHPLASILSSYRQAFFEVPYAHRLEHLARKYAEQIEVMNHWKAMLGDRIHTVRYEDIVADPEGQARALVDFVGVPWDERVLRFHENPEAVRTASQAQVRRPIYASSVDDWRRYEHHLEPARQIVSAMPDDPYDGDAGPGEAGS